MNIAEQLNAKGATPETLLEVLKTSVFEVSGERTSNEMRTELESASGAPERVAQALQDLRNDPDLVREIALLWISSAADGDDDRRTAVEGAVADADRQMPLIEIGAITLVALYAIYMIAPPKPTKIKRKLTRRADGSFAWEETVENEGFTPAVRGLLGIFGGRRQ